MDDDFANGKQMKIYFLLIYTNLIIISNFRIVRRRYV